MQKIIEFLNRLYPEPKDVFLRGFKLERKTLYGNFLVPKEQGYSPFINYTTEEQYLRCISQGGYMLVGLLVEMGAVPKVNLGDFEHLMFGGMMYYHSLSLHSPRKVPRGTSFELTLHLEEILEKGNFFSCTLRIKGPVRGVVEFVSPKT